MREFKDSLPLNGKVRLKNEDEIFIYRGFEGPNTRRCAVTREGEPYIVWLDRSALVVVEES